MHCSELSGNMMNTLTDSEFLDIVLRSCPVLTIELSFLVLSDLTQYYVHNRMVPHHKNCVCRDQACNCQVHVCVTSHKTSIKLCYEHVSNGLILLLTKHNLYRRQYMQR